MLKYQDLENMIFNLNRSQAVKVEVLGKSVDKRSIYSLEIGSGTKTIIFETGAHARETANPIFIMKFICDLVNRFEEKDQEIIKLLKKVKIIVIPCVNPDGYDAILFGRKIIENKKSYIYKCANKIDFRHYKANANGVDLNRSFPSQHAGLYYKEYSLSETVSFKRTTEKNKFYCGKKLGHESEVKAMIYLINKHLDNLSAYISLHSAGRVIYAGKPNLFNNFNKNSLSFAKKISKINNYQTLNKTYEEVGEGTDGTSTDYVSELVSGFLFSTKTKRLSASSYKKPKVKNNIKTKIITLETLEEVTNDLTIIKKEYYQYKLSKVFEELIKEISKN